MGKDFLSSHEIESDKKVLANCGRPLKEYADTHIAHIDPNPPENLATWGDVDNAFKSIETVLRKSLSSGQNPGSMS